jgi:hypothetical protein
MAFESYLDQVDDASGSAATIGDTYASQIKVPNAVGSHTLRNVLIAIWAALAVLAIGGVLLWGRSKSPPSTPPPATASP